MLYYKSKYYNIEGYKVLIVSNPEFVSNTIRIVMKVGSANDFKGKNGISYIIAKLICINSSSGYSVLDHQNHIFDSVERESTSFACEIYHSRYIETLEYILSKIYYTNFNENMIETAKRITKLKLLSSTDSIDSNVLHTIQEQIFARQVIGKPIYGKLKTIKNITRENIIEFYNRYYHTKNSIIVIATKDAHDKVIQQIKPVLQKYFVHKKESVFTAFKKYTFHSRNKKIYKNIKQSFIGLVAKSEGFKDYHNVIRIKFLQNLLNSYKELKNKYSIECMVEIYNSVSIVCLIFRSLTNESSQLVQSIKSLITNIKITDLDVYTAIKNETYQQEIGRFNSNEISKIFGEHFLHLRKVKKDNFDIEIMQSITIESVKIMLQNIFSQNMSSMFVFGPKIRPPIS